MGFKQSNSISPATSSPEDPSKELKYIRKSNWVVPASVGAKGVVLTSRSEGSQSYLYGGATICAGVFDYVLIKREEAPSTAEHHRQKGLTEAPSAPVRILPQYW